MAKNQFPLIAGISLFLGIILFLFQTGLQTSEVSRIIDWNITSISLLGSAIVLFVLNPATKGFVATSDPKELLVKYPVGVLFGFVAALVVSFGSLVFSIIPNLISPISVSSIGSITSVTGVLAVVFIQPFTETVLLIVTLILLLFLFNALKPVQKVSGFLASFFTSIIFSLFHGFSLSTQIDVPFNLASLDGMFYYVFNFQGLGQAGYVGGFPYFLLGLLFCFLILAFKDWIIAFYAHLINNFLALYFSGSVVGSAALILNLTAFVLVFFLITVLFVLKSKTSNAFKNFQPNSFIKGVFS